MRQLSVHRRRKASPGPPRLTCGEPRPYGDPTVQRSALIGAVLLFMGVVQDAQAANQVFWGNYGGSPASISFANLDGSGGGDLNTAGATVSEPLGLAIDIGAGRVYWANDSAPKISFANLDGGGGGDLDTTGATTNPLAGIAIDPGAGKVYWGNYAPDTISFASLDGSGAGGDLNIVGTTPEDPSGIAIDPAVGRIYWASDSPANKISFANLDGSGGGDLNTSGATVDRPFGVALDSAAGKIYWANFGPASRISFANLDGSGGGDLSITGTTVEHPLGVALDPPAGRIYWGDGTDHISYANLDGSGGGELITAGASLDSPAFPALLQAPSGTGIPAITGRTSPRSPLRCSDGAWAPDLLGSFLYPRASELLVPVEPRWSGHCRSHVHLSGSRLRGQLPVPGDGAQRGGLSLTDKRPASCVQDRQGETQPAPGNGKTAGDRPQRRTADAHRQGSREAERQSGRHSEASGQGAGQAQEEAQQPRQGQSAGEGHLHAKRRHGGQPGEADQIEEDRPPITQRGFGGACGYAQRRCGSWSSPTSCPTPRPRNAVGGSPTRSRRCAGSGSRSRRSASRWGAASTRPQRGGSRACSGGSVSTSSTPTTAWPAPAPSSPGRRRCSSPSTAPTSATGRREDLPRAGPSHRPGRGRLAGPVRSGGGRPGLPRVPGGAVLPCGLDLDRFGPIQRTEARRQSASNLTAATCSSPPTRLGRRSATIEPPRSPRPPGQPCWPAATSSPTGCASGSTPPTPCWSPPTTRASASPAWKPSPARCRCSRLPSGSPPTPSRAWPAASARPFDPAAWAVAARVHLDEPTPRISGRARAVSLSAARMADRTIVAYRDVLGLS